MPERGRLHRRRLCKGKAAGEGRRKRAAAQAGPGERGPYRGGAAPRRPRPPPPAPVAPRPSGRRRARRASPASRASSPVAAAARPGAVWRPCCSPLAAPPDYSSRRAPRRPADQSHHGGGRSRAPLANEGEGEGRSAAAEREWWEEREEVERLLSMVAAEVRRGRFRRVCGLAGRLMADAVPAAEH